MICHMLIAYVLSHYIVNSKGCRCVPAKFRYFSGKMSLKVCAGAAVWAVYFAYLRKVFKRYNIAPSKATPTEYDFVVRVAESEFYSR